MSEHKGLGATRRPPIPSNPTKSQLVGVQRRDRRAGVTAGRTPMSRPHGRSREPTFTSRRGSKQGAKATPTTPSASPTQGNTRPARITNNTQEVRPSQPSPTNTNSPPRDAAANQAAKASQTLPLFASPTQRDTRLARTTNNTQEVRPSQRSPTNTNAHLATRRQSRRMERAKTPEVDG